MKKILEGYLFNRIEKLGNKKYNHIGFEDDKNSFGEMMANLVPQVGTKKKARLSIELLDESVESKKK